MTFPVLSIGKVSLNYEKNRYLLHVLAISFYTFPMQKKNEIHHDMFKQTVYMKCNDKHLRWGNQAGYFNEELLRTQYNTLRSRIVLYRMHNDLLQAIGFRVAFLMFQLQKYSVYRYLKQFFRRNKFFQMTIVFIIEVIHVWKSEKMESRSLFYLFFEKSWNIAFSEEKWNFSWKFTNSSENPKKIFEKKLCFGKKRYQKEGYRNYWKYFEKNWLYMEWLYFTAVAPDMFDQQNANKSGT